MDLDPIAKVKIRKILRTLRMSLDSNFRQEPKLTKFMFSATVHSKIIPTSYDGKCKQQNKAAGLKVVEGKESDVRAIVIANREVDEKEKEKDDKIEICAFVDEVGEANEVAIDDGSEAVNEEGIVDEVGEADEVGDSVANVAVEEVDEGAKKRTILIVGEEIDEEVAMEAVAKEKKKMNLLIAKTMVAAAQIQDASISFLNLTTLIFNVSKQMGQPISFSSGPMLVPHSDSSQSLNSSHSLSIKKSLTNPKPNFSIRFSNLIFNGLLNFELKSTPFPIQYFSPSIPIPPKPNLSFILLDPFLTHQIKPKHDFSIYFSPSNLKPNYHNFNFTKRAYWNQMPWILLFPHSSWPVALVPLWIWDEVRRTFSIGVFFSSAGPNSRSSSFFLVW